MVGKAVRYGSGNRGGRAYQVMAVILTYCCIAANYMPDIIEMVVTDFRNTRAAQVQPATGAVTTENATTMGAAPAQVGTDNSADTVGEPSILRAILALILLVLIIFGLALAAPFLAGAGNIIGLLIIGFALWEAWKFTKRVQLPITGPYKLGNAPASGVVAGGGAT
jgi:hypothetical protein